MLGTDIGNREVSVLRRRVIVVMALAAAMVCGIASASGDVDAGAAAARKVVMRDDLISPSSLTMTRNEVLEFENDSGQFMKLVFVEPQEQADRIRCYPIDHRIGRPAQAPWMLFDWGPGGRLTATIPPGKFASACSLLPGQYVFVARRLGRDSRGADYSLGTKGTITVQ